MKLSNDKATNSTKFNRWPWLELTSLQQQQRPWLDLTSLQQQQHQKQQQKYFIVTATKWSKSPLFTAATTSTTTTTTPAEQI